MSSRKYTDRTLKDLISEMLKNSGMDRKFNELEVIQCYKKAVGDIISKKTKDVYLKDRTLVIKMDSGALKQEMFFEKKKILNLINDQLQAPFLEDIEVW
jgi:hypothetical protein